MENLTIAQLKEVCDQKGIGYNTKTTKKQLIATLSGNEKSAQTGKTFKGEY